MTHPREYGKILPNPPSEFNELLITYLESHLDRKYVQKLPWLGISEMGVNKTVGIVDFLEFFGLTIFSQTDKKISNQNFHKHYDVVYSGCSETTGRLLAKDDWTYDQIHHVWGEIVANSLNQSRINISFGGASIHAIVSSVLSHIKNNGAPEHLFLLFPPASTRLVIPQSDNLKDQRGHRIHDTFSHAGHIGIDTPNYSKLPFDANEVLSSNFATYFNIQQILVLETIAELTDINLIYSTWGYENDCLFLAANETAKKLNTKVPFKNYVSNPHTYAGNNAANLVVPLPESCHQELKSHEFFDVSRNAHMGVHPHAHIAEMFQKELTKRGYSATL